MKSLLQSKVCRIAMRCGGETFGYLSEGSVGWTTDITRAKLFDGESDASAEIGNHPRLLPGFVLEIDPITPPGVVSLVAALAIGSGLALIGITALLSPSVGNQF